MTDLHYLGGAVHVELVTLLIVMFGFIGTWYSLMADSRWHTVWIKTHGKECDELWKANAVIIATLQAQTAKLILLYEMQEQHMARFDTEIMRLRDRKE